MTTIRHAIRELSVAGRAPVSTTAEITGVRESAPNYLRLTLSAPEIAAYSPTLPADGVKVGVQHGDAHALRAFTVASRPDENTVEIDILRHSGGLVGAWLADARVGDSVPFHAVRREFAVGTGITDHLLVCDASALPAAATILRHIPSEHTVHAWVHAPASADIDALLPEHAGLSLHRRLGELWDAEELIDELAPVFALSRSTRIQCWIAAESALVASLRTSLRAAGISRDDMFAAAYWKRGMGSSARDAQIMRLFQESAARGDDLFDREARNALEARADHGGPESGDNGGEREFPA